MQRIDYSNLDNDKTEKKDDFNSDKEAIKWAEEQASC